MEFKFRSFNKRSSTYFSPPENFSSSSSNFSYFTQQAMRAGFSTPALRRSDLPRNQNGAFRDSLQRELEKERIRAEIIAEEIVRRRVLEEEVRREMMMEREMALRFGSPGPMLFESRLSLLTNFNGQDRFRLRGFETQPFQRDPGIGIGNGNGNSSGVTLQEIKGPAPQVNKDKLIILAKPSANSADLKRKATTPPGGADVDLTSIGLKKHKTKDNWSCALCRITATSERGLNEHLHGKKHKAQEIGMVAQRTGFGVRPLPTITANTNKPAKGPRINNTPSFEMNGGKVGGGKSSSAKDETPSQKTPGAQNTLLQRKENSVEKKETGEATIPQTTPATAKPKKKFRFWCAKCQVGAYSQKVMNGHKRGKKHLGIFPEFNQSEEKKSAQNVVTEEKKEPDVETEEIKKEIIEEQVDSTKGKGHSDLSTIENKDKVIESVVGDVITEQLHNDQAISGSGADC